jgi:RNA-metabolising metallo-beta-lactamase.
MFGDVYKRWAEVTVLNSLSAHAGQDALVSYVKQVAGSLLKNTFLVHGELPPQEKLSAQVILSGFRNVAILSRGDRVEINR